MGTKRGAEQKYDNLATAVAEHDGNLVRFHPRFLAFAREYNFYPRACHLAAGWEKGKVERGGVGYVRQNFWPLRQFTDLTDSNRQVRQWLQQVANPRLHRETRQRPLDRFRPDALRPLPALAPDYRDSVEALVYKDFRVHFDGNRYCAPPLLIGQLLIVKADAEWVTLYHQDREVARYSRSWRRGQTFGAERFEKELLAQRAAAQRSHAQQRLIALLAGACAAETVQAYLRGLADSGRSLARQITGLLDLFRYYRPEAIAAALPESARRPSLRCRLCGQPPASAAVAARSPATPPAQRPGTQSTGHRSAVTLGLRRLDSPLPKGIP